MGPIHGTALEVGLVINNTLELFSLKLKIRETKTDSTLVELAKFRALFIDYFVFSGNTKLKLLN